MASTQAGGEQQQAAPESYMADPAYSLPGPSVVVEEVEVKEVVIEVEGAR